MRAIEFTVIVNWFYGIWVRWDGTVLNSGKSMGD